MTRDEVTPPSAPFGLPGYEYAGAFTCVGSTLPLGDPSELQRRGDDEVSVAATNTLGGAWDVFTMANAREIAVSSEEIGKCEILIAHRERGRLAAQAMGNAAVVARVFPPETTGLYKSRTQSAGRRSFEASEKRA